LTTWSLIFGCNLFFCHKMRNWLQIYMMKYVSYLYLK